MKFVAILSALLAAASAVPVYDVLPTKYMGGDLMGMTGMYDPMYTLWTGVGGMHKLGMDMYGPHRNYGLMGMGMKDWDLHRFTGMYPGMIDYGMFGGDMVGDMRMRGMVDPMIMDKMMFKHGMTSVDKMMCYQRFGIERCNIMMMHMMHKMMPYKMMY
ncbi:unnamed protein product [Acanthoscelides obtectus]|uniref:Uncharacterized protein n=1 Tax=Acanthoscelides obtectus TaxID=200917 RepID=A0A9P0JXU6_ACAOB|nr:unnamed protein product [Acanthoscelides obtectus]CAK1631512.1 hypothetical protein AOBTE_LOCUS6985 [Acanthoscelides obtectus]